MQISRPHGLPEFEHPPLDEVVLGVQFDPRAGYQQIFAGEVRDLFKRSLPKVAEHPPLEPQFELFGTPGTQEFRINFAPPIIHNRYWFLSDDEHDLVQFQNDKLLRNWRQLEGKERAPYPRFDNLLEKFSRDFTLLSDYFRKFENKPLSCNQVEVAYINKVYGNTVGSANPSAYFKVFGIGETSVSDFNVNWRRPLYRPDKSPYGRLICSLFSAVDALGKDVMVLNLTVRGRPTVGTLGNTLEFMRQAREIIVNEFASITTDAAHERWGRV